MKGFLCSFLLPLFLLAGYALKEVKAAQPGPTREAIARGEVREVLSAMEANALEAERNSDWAEASNSYRGAANSARLSGQLQKAVAYGTKALEMGEKAGAPGLQAGAIWHLAFAYRMLRQDDRAREWIEKGIEVTKRMGDEASRPVIQANFYRELGWNFFNRGETQKAIEHLSQSLQILEARLAFLRRIPAQRLKMPQAIQNIEDLAVLTLDGLGIAYQRAGNVEEAIKTYDKGLRIIKESGLKTPTEVNLYHRLGELYRGQKEFTRSLENLQKALEMAEKVNHASFISLASSQIGNLLLETQRPSEAIPYYKKAIENIESTRSLLESEEFRQSYFEGARSAYFGMIRALLSLGKHEEAFNYTERTRSRAFLDLLGTNVSLSKKAELIAAQAELERQLAAFGLGGREEDLEEELRARDPIFKATQRAETSYNEFLAKVRKESKEQASLMTVEPLKLKEVQELLDSHETMLSYFVTPQRVLLWVVDKEKAVGLSFSISRKELVGKLRSLRRAISEKGSLDQSQGVAQDLYKLLMEPALPHIRSSDLIIVPHDVLHYLPFQALYSPNGRYLLEDYSFSYLSSASLLKFTREKRRAMGEAVLAFGDPELGEKLKLPFADLELNEIKKIYPRSAALLVKKEATKERLKKFATDFDVLHIAAPVELKDDDPLRSAILLAREGKDDGRLETKEIFGLNLHASLVVLSAMETGLEGPSSGDEFFGLARAFIYAGTPSVITTLWRVDDRARSELVREFYANLKTQKKSEALRRAQLKIMKEFSQPFFWAAYGLTGEP